MKYLLSFKIVWLDPLSTTSTSLLSIISLTLDVVERTTKKYEPQAGHERDANYPRSEHERIEADRGRELEWIESLLSGRGRYALLLGTRAVRDAS